MQEMNMLKHIARLYLELYRSSRNITSPLTDRQLKQASNHFRNVLIYQNADASVAKSLGWDEVELDTRSILDIASDLIARYRRENNLVRRINREDAAALHELFRQVIEEHLCEE